MNCMEIKVGEVALRACILSPLKLLDLMFSCSRDNETRQMFRKIHVAYTNVMSNPFYTPGSKIESKLFNATINSLLGIRE